MENIDKINLEKIAQAIQSQDYQTAEKILQQLQQTEIETENIWIKLYQAQLQEGQEKLEKANQNYRELLQKTNNIKIISAARSGIKRIETINNQRKKSKETEIIPQTQTNIENQSNQINGNKELGILILEPILPELKETAAKQLASIFNIDIYTARLQIPTRSWRLYKTGKIQELEKYATKLKLASIPNFCQPINAIEKITVKNINYFESIHPNGIVNCQEKDREEKITFKWEEITKRVSGILPIFENVIERNFRGKTKEKTKTLDYVQIWDLHLNQRNIILRLCDRQYHFHQGITFLIGESTSREKWNHLNQILNKRLSNTPKWTEFQGFGETAKEFHQILKQIQPNLKLARRHETYWDAAFELYSGLIFLKN